MSVFNKIKKGLEEAINYEKSHNVEYVYSLSEFKLNVKFYNGVTKIYDLKPLFEKLPLFKYLENNPQIFADVTVDVGGYGIIWNDGLDLSCDELWKNGKTI